MLPLQRLEPEMAFSYSFLLISIKGGVGRGSGNPWKSGSWTAVISTELAVRAGSQRIQPLCLALLHHLTLPYGAC